jgi:hypothetical protein
MRSGILALSILSGFAVTPAFAKPPDYSGPVETTRSYLLATKATDVEAAKKCWTIDDENASGALDVVVGMWIASRKLVAAAEAKLGPDAVKALGRWNRVHGTNAAIDTTIQRLGNVRIQERGDTALLRIDWQPEDGETNPAFLCVKTPLVFRRVAGEWKLDANVFTGTEKAADLFAEGKVWQVWRDEMAVMTELTGLLDKGVIKDVPTFVVAMQRRVEVLKVKYEK